MQRLKVKFCCGRAESLRQRNLILTSATTHHTPSDRYHRQPTIHHTPSAHYQHQLTIIIIPPYTISPISPPPTIIHHCHHQPPKSTHSKFQSVSREMNCDCYFLIRMIHLSGYWYVPEFKRLLEIDQLIQESWDTDEMLKDKKYFDLSKLSLLEFWDTRRNSKIKDILNLPSICHYWNPPVLNPLTCSP